MRRRNLIAINVQQPGTDTTFFVYTDYLGSLRCITDSAGNVKQRLGFDAWGNRRNAITGEKLSALELEEVGMITSRGFIGHEHLDELGLINMNARVYDPSIGLFLSPDNYVQDPDFTQNFNRYAYCLNNPLMYTDPTGNNFSDWLSDNWKPIVVAAVAITATVITAGLAAPLMDAVFIGSFSAAVGGGVAGAVDAALSGGDFGQIVSGGTLGFTTGGIMGFATAGLGSALGNAPVATNQAGNPVPLADVIKNNLTNNQLSSIIGSIGSVASTILAENGGVVAAPGSPGDVIRTKPNDPITRYTDETTAYKTMWNNSQNNRWEYVGLLCGDKSVIVFPTDLPKEGSIGGGLSHYKENGVWNVKYGDKSYQISGVIHTHWQDNSGVYGFSYADLRTSLYTLKNTPLFLMDKSGSLVWTASDGVNVSPGLPGLEGKKVQDLFNGFSLYNFIYSPHNF